MRQNNNNISATISIVLVLISGILNAQTWNTLIGNNLTGSTYLGSDGSSTSPLQLKTIETGGNSLPIDFFTDNTQRATISTNGNVGIGTDSPAYSLHVNGTIAAKQILIETNSETKDLLALITQLQAEVAELKQQFIAFGKN